MNEIMPTNDQIRFSIPSTNPQSDFGNGFYALKNHSLIFQLSYSLLIRYMCTVRVGTKENLADFSCDFSL